MSFILNTHVRSLLQSGRYCIQTPEIGLPTLKTVFYLDGDLIVFTDEPKLELEPELESIHHIKIQQFVADIDKNLKRFQNILAIIIFLLSWLSLFMNDVHILVSVLSSSILGILLIRFKKILGKVTLKIFFKRFLLAISRK